MDSDTEMTNGIAGVLARETKPYNPVVKIVRNLDQHGPGENGKNLFLLWRTLSGDPLSFHAPKQSCLRWLLKMMNSSTKTSPNHETIRRWPYTWDILRVVFETTPSFQLAKALADRRFMAVLQQTLHDLSNPTGQGISSPPVYRQKRKREDQTAPFDADILRKPEFCLRSAVALFEALRSMLDRLEDKTVDSAREATGIEHIKSLFRCPADELLKIVRPMFVICQNATSHPEQGSRQQIWLITVSRIWDLRRRDRDDCSKAAEAISRIAFQILLDRTVENEHEAECRLDAFTSTYYHWHSDLENFIEVNLVLPARSAFLARDSTHEIEEIIRRTEDLPVAVFRRIFRFAQDCPTPSDSKSQDKLQLWMNNVLKLIDRSLSQRPFEERSTAMKGILSSALDQTTKIDEVVLKDICLNYAFDSEHICWGVVSEALRLDPDIAFGMVGEERLHSRICRCINEAMYGSYARGDLQSVAHQVAVAFVNAKDVLGFFQMWCDQLSIVESAYTSQKQPHSPWFDPDYQPRGFRGSRPHFLDLISERIMTVDQLIGILEWIDTNNDVRPGPSLVMLDCLASSLTTQEFTHAAGPSIVNVVLKNLNDQDVSSEMRPLRWLVLSKVAGWLEPEARDVLWEKVGSLVADILKTDAFDAGDHLNAFKFLLAFWEEVLPERKYRPELESLGLYMATRMYDEASRLCDKAQVLGWPVDRDESYWAKFGYYMDEIVSKSQHSLLLLFEAAGGKLPAFLEKAVEEFLRDGPDALPLSPTQVDRSYWGTTPLEELFTLLLEADDVLNSRPMTEQVVDLLIVAWSRTIETRANTGELFHGRLTKIFINVPDERISRSQRETVLSRLFTLVRDVDRHGAVKPDRFQLLMTLGVKMLSKPAFYEGIQFHDLLALSTAVSKSFMAGDVPRPVAETGGLTRLYTRIASAIIQQMAAHPENNDSAGFIQGMAAWIFGNSSPDEVTGWPCLHMILFSTVIDALSRVSGPSSHLVNVDLEAARKRLADLVRIRLLACTDGSSDTLADPKIYGLLATLEAAEVVPSGSLKNAGRALDKLRKWSEESVRAGHLRGWKMGAFLLKHDPDNGGGLDLFGVSRNYRHQWGDAVVFDAAEDVELVQHALGCAEAVFQRLGPSDQFVYAKSLVDKLKPGRAMVAQVVAVHRIVQDIIGLPGPASKEHDLSAIYTKLASTAREAASATMFSQICSTLHLILNSSTHATQWNIEETLALVAYTCSTNRGFAYRVKTSHETYEWLCRLVELILKRHRLRIEGHFHMLIATLQALLKALVLHPYDDVRQRWAYAPLEEESSYGFWAEHAAACNRVIATVCHPTAGAVARSHGRGHALDAAADVAKRAAGRQMYLVLMTYIRLQIEAAVPRTVREALEPGMNAIFDITPPEVRKILGDGLDGSGREILGDMYKRYKMFGKWTGK